MRSPGQWRDSQLLWQGLLVAAPTLLLAGIGLVFVRQVWIWAEREGQALARQTANELALVRLPGLLQNGLLSFDPFSTRRLTRLDLSPDPVLELSSARLPRVALIVDERGALAYPPPMSPWPVPQPEEEALPSSSRRDSAESASRERIARSAYRLGRAREQRGDYPGARREYERILEQFPDVHAESGLPLRIVAGLRLVGPEFLSASTAGQRAGLVPWLTAEAVYRPTPLSETILRILETTRAQAELAKAASRLFESHQQARELFVQVSDQVEAIANGAAREQALAWVDDAAGSKWLMVPVRDGRNRWILFLTKATARKAVTEAVAAYRTPPYFRIAMDIAGQPVIPAPPGPNALASVNSTEQLNGLGGIRTSVYLTDPRAFYARVRLQTVWLTAFIVLSMGAVVAGLSSAGRAFRQQQHLMELKSNFVSSVSHELRAPIASMRLLTEELADFGSAAPEKQAEYHHLIIRECKRLTHLIENVLEFSRKKTQHNPADWFAPTDPAALLEETLQLMRPVAAEQAIRLHICTPATRLPMIQASASGLQRALLNLVDNAIKYSAPNAIVTLGGDFIPAAESGKAHVELWVEDQGKGIDPGEQSRIFEPFYRCGSEMRRETQGVGLGLTIVRQIVEAHNGQVRVNSTAGQGSRFTLGFPVTCRNKNL